MRPLSDLANDFWRWRMDGDSYPADPMIDLAKADDAVNLFKKGKKLDLKFQIGIKGQ